MLAIEQSQVQEPLLAHVPTCTMAVAMPHMIKVAFSLFYKLIYVMRTVHSMARVPPDTSANPGHSQYMCITPNHHPGIPTMRSGSLIYLLASSDYLCIKWHANLSGSTP